MISKVVNDSIKSIIIELDEKKLVETYVKKWFRISEFVYLARKAFSENFLQYIARENWDSLATVALKVIRD